MTTRYRLWGIRTLATVYAKQDCCMVNSNRKGFEVISYEKSEERNEGQSLTMPDIADIEIAMQLSLS